MTFEKGALMGFVNAKEQSETFERLSDVLTAPVAVFCICAVYNVPFYAEIASVDRWSEYITSLNGIGHADCFENGETSYSAAVIAGMDKQERWETVWGEGYSENDYKRLDELYLTMTAQLDQLGGSIDRQQEDTARTCARMALQRDKLIRSQNKDDVTTAKNFDEMIRKNLQDANMRKADILPNQKQRLDGVVDAIRKRFGAKGDLTYDEVMRGFYKWTKEHKHPQTVDAEEHALLAILRNIQKNDDMPEPSELPDDMRLGNFANQFAQTPNEQEHETYDYLHLVREKFTEDDGDGDD